MSGERKTDAEAEVDFKRLFLIAAAAYIALAVLFYYLAGEQLRLRQSRGDISLPPAESVTIDLEAGRAVEQRFQMKIQRLESIGVLWGTYYRPNTGTVVMELHDLKNERLVLAQSFDASGITEGALTSLVPDEPLEGLYAVPLMLRIYSPDSPPGAAVTPLMSTTSAMDDAALYFDGEPVEGLLCFTASGTDYIWTGLHYWEFMAAGLALLVLAMWAVWRRYRRGKRSYVLNAVTAVVRYRFLIRQLVSRDFKTKYKRSVLGIFWSFLNPLLMMCVQYFVFSTVFKNDIENFAAYLLIGVVMFNFFSEACGMALPSILGNANLITKVYVPKYIYPLTRVVSSLVNLLISLIPLIIVCLATGVRFHRSAVLSVYFLMCLVVFCIGLGLLLSASMVFFRDTQFLWGILSMMWMYATPIFYPETILPDGFRFVLEINPLYYFLKSTRTCILDGISPEPMVYLQCLLIALGMLLVGALIFRKSQDKFVLYL